MKALTDKIIEKLENLSTECDDNSEFQKGLNTAINYIKHEEIIAEFEEVARVMMKHLNDGNKYHPHNTVILTSCTAELLEGVQAMGHVMDYVKDY